MRQQSVIAANPKLLDEAHDRGAHRLSAPYTAAYGSLCIIFIWFGAMKFTAYEAEAISGLVANSPVISFLTLIMSRQGVSNLIGITEITIALLLAARAFSPKLSAIGACGAIATFVVTFSFFFSTPGVFLEDTGGAAISVLPGQFLLKDLALLCLSIMLLSESRQAIAKA